MSASSTPQELDVAIVGGGVAGCYAAYRLLTGEIAADSPLGKIKAENGDQLKVGLFEYSGRVGGRMRSAEIPQQNDPDQPVGAGETAPRQFAEFGGFRFQTQQHIVRDLADHLGLEHEPFPVDEPQDNFVFVRNQRFTRAEINAGKDLPYKFTPGELEIVQGQWAAEGNPDLSTYVANQAFQNELPNSSDYVGKAPYFPDGLPNGYDTLKEKYQKAFRAEDWAQVDELREQYETAKQKVTIAGRPFSEWSWWALQTRFLSDEAITFGEETGGYNGLWSSGSAPTNLVDDFFFFGVSNPADPCVDTAWVHITTGYSDIPNLLYTRFLDAGGTGNFHHQLLGFEKGATGGYELSFLKRNAGTDVSTAQGENDPASERVSVHAKYLILAMPKHSLELLDQSNFFFLDQAVQSLIGSVLQDPAIRIFMAYPNPWWTEKGVTCGRNTTDLPVRQFYYWYTAQSGAENQESFVLASYANAEAQRYWEAIQVGKTHFDDLNGAATKRDYDIPSQFGPRQATKVMGDLAHAQLKQVVGVDDAPEPYYVHYQDWVKDPWGAGWHAWTTHPQDSNQLIPQIYQPIDGEDVYICGECYSNVQGWVQGALNTSEVLLQKKLGLSWPDWLSEGGTWLGPGSEGLGRS